MQLESGEMHRHEHRNVQHLAYCSAHVAQCLLVWIGFVLIIRFLRRMFDTYVPEVHFHLVHFLQHVDEHWLVLFHIFGHNFFLIHLVNIDVDILMPCHFIKFVYQLKELVANLVE